MYFFKNLTLSILKGIGGLMLCNVLNLVSVRMQNVDYPNNRSFTGALKDLIVIDKHRMFYKGLLPITIACTNLYCIQDMMHMFRNPELAFTHYIWPFVFLGGTLLVHPFMNIGMRV